MKKYIYSDKVSTSTVPPRSILINEGRNSAISTTDNNTNKPYLEVCEIPKEENKIQCIFIDIYLIITNK